MTEAENDNDSPPPKTIPSALQTTPNHQGKIITKATVESKSQNSLKENAGCDTGEDFYEHTVDTIQLDVGYSSLQQACDSLPGLTSNVKDVEQHSDKVILPAEDNQSKRVPQDKETAGTWSLGSLNESDNQQKEPSHLLNRSVFASLSSLQEANRVHGKSLTEARQKIVSHSTNVNDVHQEEFSDSLLQGIESSDKQSKETNVVLTSGEDVNVLETANRENKRKHADSSPLKICELPKEKKICNSERNREKENFLRKDGINSKHTEISGNIAADKVCHKEKQKKRHKHPRLAEKATSRKEDSRDIQRSDTTSKPMLQTNQVVDKRTEKVNKPSGDSCNNESSCDNQSKDTEFFTTPGAVSLVKMERVTQENSIERYSDLQFQNKHMTSGAKIGKRTRKKLIKGQKNLLKYLDKLEPTYNVAIVPSENRRDKSDKTRAKGNDDWHHASVEDSKRPKLQKSQSKEQDESKKKCRVTYEDPFSNGASISSCLCRFFKHSD